jgi:hypothetical protein
MPLTCHLHASFDSIPHTDWDRCFPGEVERHAYYAAWSRGSDTEPVAATVSDGGRVVAAAPLFHMAYRLDTSLQGPLRRLMAPFAAFATLRLTGLGSPLAERCHVGFDARLGEMARHAALDVLLGGVEAHARREGVGLVAVKDLAGPDAATAAPVLSGRGYSRVSSLPLAVLEVPPTEEAYLSLLSASTRKDVRRKMRRAGRVTVEVTHDIGAVAPEIETLYAETRSQSRVDYGEFEELPPGYFSAVSRALGDDAAFVLYRVDGRLAAFNLLLLSDDRIIDKFLGMRYPLAREHDLYVLSWMTNLRLCLARGARHLQTGQTAYASKLRLGSRLEPTEVWFRHRNPAINLLLRTFAPLLAFDRNDPDLKVHAERVRAR